MERLRSRGGADLAPAGEEARAQRRAGAMPIVWLALGAVVVIAFILAVWRPWWRPSPVAGRPDAPQSAAPPTKAVP